MKSIDEDKVFVDETGGQNSLMTNTATQAAPAWRFDLNIEAMLRGPANQI